MASSRRLAQRVDELLAQVAARGALAGAGASPAFVDNLVAFSGGVDSSLAAALVHRAFPLSSAACLGVSAALPRSQLEQARIVAGHIGIPLWETPTREAALEGYVANQGRSCYFCKTTLYATINQVAAFAQEEMGKRWAATSGRDGGSGSTPDSLRPVIYNGTNADDQQDPTRVGLVAATEFQVVSPLGRLSKAEVREVAKYLGLPNWNTAASPCLRSRLQFGVEATQTHLQRIEEAEEFVRRAVGLQSHMNMRVRFLAGNRAAVELDREVLDSAMQHADAVRAELCRLGFTSVEIRAFRSGSLSGYTGPGVTVAVEHTEAFSMPS